MIAADPSFPAPRAADGGRPAPRAHQRPSEPTQRVVSKHTDEPRGLFGLQASSDGSAPVDTPCAAPEIPACAAIRFNSGLIVAEKRHDRCIKATIGRFTRAEVAEAEQGFMTTRGRFVDRREAWILWVAAGGRVEREGIRILFSEDLY